METYLFRLDIHSMIQLLRHSRSRSIAWSGGSCGMAGFRPYEIESGSETVMMVSSHEEWRPIPLLSVPKINRLALPRHKSVARRQPNNERQSLRSGEVHRGRIYLVHDFLAQHQETVPFAM